MPPPSQYQAYRLLELVATNRAKIRQFDHIERDQWARADPPLRGVNYKSRASAVASLTSGNLGAKPLSLLAPKYHKPTTSIKSATVQVEHTPASAPVPPAPMPDALKGGLLPPGPSPPMPRVESSRSQMSKISSIPSFGKIREPLSSDSVRLETNISSATESSIANGSRRPRPRAPAAAAEYEEFGTEALITHVYGELEDDYNIDTESASGIFQSIGPSVSMARGIDRVGSSGGVAEKKEKGVVMGKGKGTRQIKAAEGREYRGYVPEKKDSFSREQGEYYENSGVHIPSTYQQAAVKHTNSEQDHAADVGNTYEDNDEPYEDDGYNEQPIATGSMSTALNSSKPQQRKITTEGTTTTVTNDQAEVQQILSMDMAPQVETESSKLENDIDYDYGYSYEEDEETMMSQQAVLPPAPVPPPYESLVSAYEDEAAPPSLEMDMEMQGLQYGLSGMGLDHKLADGDDASPLTDGIVDSEYINPPDANYQSSGSSDESEDDLIAERRRAHGGIHPESLPSTRTSDDHSHDLVGSESDFLSRSEYTGYSKDDTYGYGEGGHDENGSFDSDAATRGRDVTTVDDEDETVSEVDVDEPEQGFDEDVFPNDEIVSRVREIDLGDNLTNDNENRRRGGMKYISKGKQRRATTGQERR